MSNKKEKVEHSTIGTRYVDVIFIDLLYLPNQSIIF